MNETEVSAFLTRSVVKWCVALIVPRIYVGTTADQPASREGRPRESEKEINKEGEGEGGGEGGGGGEGEGEGGLTGHEYTIWGILHCAITDCWTLSMKQTPFIAAM